MTDTRNADTLAAYERAADAYRAACPDTPYPDIAAFLDRVIARVPGGTVLELGSGPGLDARYLENGGPTVTRTDATAAFVGAMRADGVEAQLLNAITDEFGGPYDAVYAGAMLLHLSALDFAAVLHKARTAARVLACTVKEGDGDEWTRARLGVPRWVKYWREDGVRTALIDAGWKIEYLGHVVGKREPWLYVIAS